AFDGTATIQQPLIAPLYGGKSALQLIASLLGQADPTGLALVQDYWRSRKAGDNFEKTWRSMVHKGVVDGTASEVKTVALKPLDELQIPGAGGDLEILFRPDPAIWDGRFANNAWLQELPRPLTRLTWENAALISPRRAEMLGIDFREMEGVSE